MTLKHGSIGKHKITKKLYRVIEMDMTGIPNADGSPWQIITAMPLESTADKIHMNDLEHINNIEELGELAELLYD